MLSQADLELTRSFQVLFRLLPRIPLGGFLVDFIETWVQQASHRRRLAYPLSPRACQLQHLQIQQSIPWQVRTIHQ
jgi:hypothetical protein